MEWIKSDSNLTKSRKSVNRKDSDRRLEETALTAAPRRMEPVFTTYYVKSGVAEDQFLTLLTGLKPEVFGGDG